ncbi:hypothetical protein BZG36_01656 [Bifiguratus adelaidae]|uniref:Phosphatidic acid phosphatase type 2/haloperoxidase domain-containing protein n=1 Tax=Bifiguratus adelaidae TaxID=1938954 RepID=A0A261Y476_9FUNG|nr:hypothetical protein BZG36_01656 [Bifiguratus adelaidae]
MWPILELRWPTLPANTPKPIRAFFDHVRWWHLPLAYIFQKAFRVIETPPWYLRLAIAVALTIGCYLPHIKHFLRPTIPIFAWLFGFYACQFIDAEHRTSHIFVNVLPTMERILYGANLSELLARNPNAVKDVLAWIPYGVLHYSIPFAVSAIIFWFGPPMALPTFARAFGWMNIMGVITQFFFPTAPPWYEATYGSEPATYSIPGSPGGLARIDLLFGTKTYTATFGASPMVFGAFPSLHSGCATIQALFLCWLRPRFAPLFLLYVMWIWWSTMYLTHHYMIDLVGGSIYALVAFGWAMRYAPKIDRDFPTRWHYLGIDRLTWRNFLNSFEMSKGWLERQDEVVGRGVRKGGLLGLWLDVDVAHFLPTNTRGEDGELVGQVYIEPKPDANILPMYQFQHKGDESKGLMMDVDLGDQEVDDVDASLSYVLPSSSSSSSLSGASTSGPVTASSATSLSASASDRK